MRAMRRWPLHVNSQPTRWRRSPNRRNRNPMFRIILFLVLIALGGRRRGLGRRSARRCRDCHGAAGALRPPLPVFVLVLGLTVVAAVIAVVDPARRCGARRSGCGAAAVNGVRPAGGMPSRKGLLGDRPRRFHRRAASRRQRAQALTAARSAGAAAACAVARQLDGDREGAQRASAPWPSASDTRLLGLRGLFIEAQRSRRSRRRRDGRRGSAEIVAVVVMGVACGARLLLRAGRLGRRAENPRQQSIGSGLIDHRRPIAGSAACC